MPWFKRKDGSIAHNDENLEDIEFKPEKLREDIETSVKTQLAEAETRRKEEMKPLLDMAASIESDRAARAEAARVAAARKTNEENEVTDEDFLLDPSGSVDRKLQGTQNAVMMVASRQARREVLEDKEYYYGDIKSKVDALIDQQPLKSRMDSSVITNCYKLVMYDHQKDITEGKIRARNTSGIFETNGTGGHSGKDAADDVEVMSNEEKHAASALGLSESDWKKSRKELSYV